MTERKPMGVAQALALADTLCAQANQAEPEAALALWREAVRTDPYRTSAWQGLAAELRRKGLWHEALKAHEAIVRLSPGDRGALLAWACAGLAALRAGPDAHLADYVIKAFNTVDDPSLLLVRRAGRLLAACHGRTSNIARHRLLELLPKELEGIPPSVEWLPFISYLAISMVYSAYSAGAGLPIGSGASTKLKKRGSVRIQVVSALRRGLGPWFKQLGDRLEMRRVDAVLRMYEASDDDLSGSICSAWAAVRDPKLLRLVVRQLLVERESDRCIAILDQVRTQVGYMPGGLDLEEVAVRERAMRESVARSNFERAQERCLGVLEVDRDNPAAQHNLALLALAGGSPSNFTHAMDAARRLWAAHWSMNYGDPHLSEEIVVTQRGLADQLGGAIHQALVRPSGADRGITPPLVSAWITEARRYLALRSALLQVEEGGSPQLTKGTVAELLIGMGDADGIPEHLMPLLDPPLGGTPPLLYARLGVPPSATNATLVGAAMSLRLRIAHELAQALAGRQDEIVASLQSRLGRIDEAAKVLTDPQSRAAYDARCIPQSHHGLHQARLDHVLALLSVVRELKDAEEVPVRMLVLHELSELPRASLQPYLNDEQADFTAMLEQEVVRLRLAPALGWAHRLAAADQWADAILLYEACLAEGLQGQVAIGVRLFAAQCELALATRDSAEDEEPAPAGRVLQAPSAQGAR